MANVSRLYMEYLNKIQLIRPGKMKEIFDEFKMPKSDESQAKIALDIVENFKPPKVTCLSKDTFKSIQFRNEGNKLIVSQKDERDKLILAWELYSKSIAFAENFSEELALAYANRSYVLFCLSKYTECVEDIDRALQLNYPEHLKAKLICRRAESLLELATDPISCTEVTQWLEKISLDDKTKIVLEKKINAFKLASKNYQQPPKIVRQQKSLPSYKKNPKIPCASNALAIKYDDKYGKHVVTTRNVRAGEILIVEKPYLLVLTQEDLYTHCSYCLKVAWASTPCERCIYAMYCSQKCKDEAWKQSHDIECFVEGYLWDMDMNSLAPLSMRLALIAIREAGSIENLKKELQQIESCEDPIAKCLSAGDVYRSDRYRALYSLVTHTDKRPTTLLVSKALNAAFIVYCIVTKTTFFGEKASCFSDMYQNVDVVFVAGLILRHYQMLQMNDHGYSEIRNESHHLLGTAVLPFSSLLNHSCHCNVNRCRSKGSFVFYALQPIEKGAQIFDDYGFNFSKTSKFDRELKMKQYYFECECVACTNNWPLFKELPMENIFKFSKAVQQKIISAMSLYITAYNNLKVKRRDILPSIIDDLTKAIDFLHDNLTMPCTELVEVSNSLIQAYHLLNGERFEMPNLR